MAFLTSLLIFMLLISESQAATSLKLHKHKTSGSAYLTHLSKRGITPNTPKLHAARKRDLGLMQGNDGVGLIFRHQLASSKIRSRCPPQGRHGNHDDS